MQHLPIFSVHRIASLAGLLCLMLCAPVKTGAQALPTATGSIAGHEYVDLGLSVWWATCNLGATQASDYGDCFGWGETAGKADFTPDNSLTYKKPGHGDILGNPDYDAARAQWGDRWRLPTRDELQALIDSCTWRWTALQDVEGYLVTSNINGKQIFLPAAGIGNGSAIDGQGEDGYYWASTSFGSDRACSLCFYRGHKDLNWYQRYYGRSIRAVTTGERVVAAAKGGNRSTMGGSGSTMGGSGSADGADQTSPTLASKENREIAVANLGDEIAVNQVKGTALTKEAVPEQTEFNGHAFVDLGLSVRWATTNIGADYPLDNGDYFAWGDTVTKKTFKPSNCRTMGKKKIDGWVIRDITTRPGFDAARSQWGEAWRMPTLAEMEELVNNCDWIFQQTNDGRSFYIVKGPKPGSQIILPLAGRIYGIVANYINENGFYWTSTADQGGFNGFYYAFYLYLSDDRVNISMDERDIGRPIRPVTDY